MSVVGEHEIGFQPGVAVWQRYLDPKKDIGLKVEGEGRHRFPKLRVFQSVKIKAAKIKTNEHTGQVTIKGVNYWPNFETRELSRDARAARAPGLFLVYMANNCPICCCA